ncbi:putative aminotransferase/cysteine desulfurase [Pilimelia anulata]|uniref:Putative aminotransferase/cysteine desulfurase n=2 Tax=Pilimelia anulata TaxID=53371 RepID=A0A8J3BK18_9ACTN|nr:putative aminotransferase/cysteine desulfurase [Pilimelia anulata]
MEDPAAMKNSVAMEDPVVPDGVGAPLLPVVGGGMPVPVVTGGTVPYANLDYAASAPALQSVADRLNTVLPYYASVHRGAGYASQVTTSLFEAARTAVAGFVGARPDDAVIFTRCTTDALNLAARAVPADGEVVFLDVEHHANLLPWRTRAHRCVEGADTLAETLERLAAALAERPAALVAITGASNVSGEVTPLRDVVALAHGHGARVLVDAAQLAPHRPIDLAATGVDYLAFAGHKLYAPFGAGALVGRRDWLDAAEPFLYGGGAVRDVTPDAITWTTGPSRHEAGSPNVLGAVAMGAAATALGALPAGAMEAQELALRGRLMAGLADLGARIVRIWEDAPDVIGLATFTLDGHDPARVAAYLSAEHGIGVRTGRFCAHPLFARLGFGREGALRASFGVGSPASDIDRLIEALGTYLKDGPRWQYAATAQGWLPQPDTRAWPAWADVNPGAGPGMSPCAANPLG